MQMAPVPKPSAILQPKYVDFPTDDDVHAFAIKASSFRPSFEKMHSCELSVEQSSESIDGEQFWQTSLCGFPTTTKSTTKSTETKIRSSDLKVLLDEDLDFPNAKGKLWKLGALDRAKTQSPTENDDLSSSASTSNAAIATQLGASCSTSDSKLELPPEGERQECGDSLLAVPENKECVKQRKGKATVVAQCHVEPKKKSKAGKTQIIKRHSIAKAKRNTYVILCPEEPQQKPKKIKIKRKTSKTRKSLKVGQTSFKQEQSHKETFKSASSAVPSGYKCVDSGISTGSGCSGGSSGHNSGSYNDSACGSGSGGGGGNSGSGSGFYKKGGFGGHGGDENDDKRPLSSGDVDMDDEEDDDDEDVKMSSKEGSDMDCHEGHVVKHSVCWERFPFQTQHLQHNAYCSKGNCNRQLCSEMSREIKHIQTCDSACLRCCKLLNLLKYHSAQCQRPSCRVHKCNELREKKDVIEQPVQIVYKPPPPPTSPITRPHIDGLVYLNVSTCLQFPVALVNQDINMNCLFLQNTGGPVDRYFQENICYIKGELVGEGGNGHVFKVHLPSWSPLYDKPMVVKETIYQISKEEVDVYKTMGDHANIVEHYLVVMKGNDGHASIFMEECDKSLKDICNQHRLDDKEAMFYWKQVLDAVQHLHGKGIIHRDIKARNVFLSGRIGNGEYFRAKLGDYDAAKLLKNEFTEAGMKPAGTSGFVSKEVKQRLPHGRPADIFSMGCFLMEIMGTTPREGYLEQQDYKDRPTALDIQNYLSTVP
ncbi:hypothetical protein QZH41_014365, partial [Actinostola sp. cb2023]